ENTRTADLANDTGGLLDFGTVAVGATAARIVTITNNGTHALARLALQLDDLDGDFVIAAPCAVDAPYCDGSVPAIAPGASVPITVVCRPLASGPVTAHLYVASSDDTY